MRIATMGIETIDPEKFQNNGDTFLNKPRFGLYGSTLIKENSNLRTGWLDFIFGDWQEKSKKYSKGISYTLHKKSKIFTIDSIEDYIELLEKYNERIHAYDNRYRISIDWNEFARDYDAFHLTEDAFWELRMIYTEQNNEDGTVDRLEDFYSYDCETWIIFNLDCINMGSVYNIHIKDYYGYID